MRLSDSFRNVRGCRECFRELRRGSRGYAEGQISAAASRELLEANGGNDRGVAEAEDEGGDKNRGQELEQGVPRTITESDNKGKNEN